MAPQMKRFHESFSTRVARVRPGSRVDQHVLGQRRPQGERLTAGFAEVWPVFGVVPHVPFQVAAAHEAEAACGAGERSLARVAHHVPAEMAAAAVAFPAGLTLVRPVCRVNLHVAHQVAAAAEASLTGSTGMRFLAGVDHHVLLE